MSPRSRLVISLLAIVLSVVGAVTKDTRLGLDLRGGSQIILDLKARGDKQLNADLASRTVEVLRKRVDSLGVAEPSLTVAGNSRIIVDLPGTKDKEEAVRVIGSTAQLTIHPVLSQGGAGTTSPVPPGSATPVPAPASSLPAPPTSAASLGTPPPSAGEQKVLGAEGDPTTTTTAPEAAQQDQMGPLTAQDDAGVTYQLGPAVVSGDGIETAESLAPQPGSGGWKVGVTFKGEGQKAWQKLTADQACKPITDPTRKSAFVLDGRIIEVSGPAETIACGEGITTKTTEITSTSFTMEETRTLALLIKGGALPVDVHIASSRYIGPELGEAAIKASIMAIIIGGILTVVFVLGYYRLLGLIAGIALGAYALVSWAALLGIGITLTLPGIAGFVLAVAMAMDSNILVYERVKEEYANGRSLRQAAHLGFKNALSAIIDSNATTFLAAAVLFFFAVGEVKGFGVTLLLGTAISIFITLVLLRSLVEGLLSLEWARKRPKALGMYVGSSFRKRMNENPPDLMGYAKWFLISTSLLAVVALAGVAVKGINYGIEFTGGKMLEYHTATPVSLEKARDEIAAIGVHQATVVHTGNSEATAKENTSVRAKSISDEQVTQLQGIMEELGGGKAEKVADSTIGPSFGNELKQRALIGLAIGLAAQLCWVAWRFRWNFGIGAVVAMIHDAVIILGLYAWLGKEFNAVFLAALLTVIAYSVNDSVVVFDRIREQRRRRAGEEFRHVVSDACAQTLPRTVNLSLSALFILGALYFFGGDTLSDFSLALVLGVITGVYSSIMIASPIAVVLDAWKPSVTAQQRAGAARRQQTRSVKATRGEQRSQVTAKPDSASDVDPETDTPDTEEDTPAALAKRPNPRPRKKSKKRR